VLFLVGYHRTHHEASQIRNPLHETPRGTLSPPHSSSLILSYILSSKSRANRVWPQSIKSTHVSNLETISIPHSINLTQPMLPLQSEKKSHTEKNDNNSCQVCSAAVTLPSFQFFFQILLFRALELQLYPSGYESFQPAPARATEPKLFFTTRLPSSQILPVPPIEIESRRASRTNTSQIPSLPFFPVNILFFI